MSRWDNEDITVLLVHKTLLAPMWLHLSPFLAKGVKAAFDTSYMDIAKDLSAGLAQLWAIFKNGEPVGSFVTAVCHDEQRGGHILIIYALGGKGLHEWAHRVEEETADFARHQGCGHVRFYGRRGWSRVLPQFTVAGSESGETMFERTV